MNTFILTLVLSFSFSFGQVTNEGEPKSWALNSSYILQEKILPSFDLNQVKSEDLINDTKPRTPWRFGYSHSVDYSSPCKVIQRCSYDARIPPDSHAVFGDLHWHAVNRRIRGQYGRAHGAEGGGLVTRRYARTQPAEPARAS